jgi:hypothetical protein
MLQCANKALARAFVIDEDSSKNFPDDFPIGAALSRVFPPAGQFVKNN